MKTSKINYNLLDNNRDDSCLKVCGILHIQRTSYPGCSFSLHSHENTLELSLILAGNGFLYCNKKAYPFQRGDLIIKNAGILHAAMPSQDVPFEHLCLNLSGVRTAGNPHGSLISKDASPIIKTGTSFSFLKQLFLYIKELCDQQPIGFEIALLDIVKALLSSICLLLPTDEKDSMNDSNFPIIRDVIEYIDSHYTTNISLEDLSDRFFFSPYYLARKFKDETGYTINQYIVSRRIGEAERMLVFENLSIKDIALKTGYTNIPYFHTAFKKHTGCTPTEFKNIYHNGK